MTERENPFVWFDFGGVLSPPLAELFSTYETKTGITPAALQAAMQAVGDDLGAHPLAPIELAQITEREWGSRLREHLAAADPDLDLSRARLETFGEQWFDGIVVNSAMASALRGLKAYGHRVGVLSNNVVEWEPYWRAIIEPAGPLDALVDSCLVGARKPDEQIFAIAEKVAGVDASQCILIDDLAQNVDAARRRGWQAIHFRSNGQAASELSRLTGIPAVL
ncbi:HAD family hydrolase [Rhodococcus tibetensis]|uniref:HAD family phosphatase n=1 Tax=Rhodococcus tibetensis TaxID=2965064 RepID=A0ABT1QG03_9NOCA|nr:HAD family phosphatase [Rhodococcus sp. FXJ9.536]MCQ4121219.1 HAD family phosphatase [Rhodococcus sp. FXJ9.536]